MRSKQLWAHFDIPSKASLVWSRITFSRLTTGYFILAILHCTIQVIFQAQAYALNTAAADKLWSFIQHGNMTQESDGFAVLANDLRICYQVPNTISTDSCQVIWTGTNQSGPSGRNAALPASVSPVTMSVASTYAPDIAEVATTTSDPIMAVTQAYSSSLSAISIPAVVTSSTPPVLTSASPSASVVTVVIGPHNAQQATGVVINNSKDDDDDNNGEEVNVRRASGFKRTADPSNDANNITPAVEVPSVIDGVVPLSDICVKTLIWPVQRLSDTKREDITFIGFQFWVLGMSIVALLNESIPHIGAALVTHVLVTIWSIYQVSDTEQFRRDFARLTTNGACNPNNLLGSYWDQRRNAEIPSAVFNGVALLVSAFFTYKLMKIYGWQTFKRIGASFTINRVYKLVLSLSIAIQLALFFIVSAMALWIDQLYHGAIGRLSTHHAIYRAGFIIVLCLLVPWLALGWFAIRREKRKLAFVFLVISFLFITLWAATFRSTTFRWIFVTWSFFTVMTVASGILIVTTFVLGVACRVNFGKGLPRYLIAEEPLDGSEFTPVFHEKLEFGDDPETVEFPSSRGRPVPTFSAAFGSGPEVPKPTQMRFGSSRGPGAGPYGGTEVSHRELEQQQRGRFIARSLSSSSSSSGSGKVEAPLARTDTRGSGSSTSSGPTDFLGKRWVIE